MSFTNSQRQIAREPFRVLISRWLCRQVDAVIVKSERMKKATLVSEGNSFIIPNMQKGKSSLCVSR